MPVRRLTPTDLDAYRALRLRSLREEAPNFGSSFEEESRLATEVWRARLDPAGPLAVFGGFVEERLIGLSGLARETSLKRRHVAWLVSIYVAPEKRGAGWARPLVGAALDHARGLKDLRAVELHVAEENRAARALYASFGFVATGRRVEAVEVEGRFYDDLSMRLPLLS